MKLVHAKATDFAFVKMLYEDDVTDMIYREPNNLKTNDKVSRSDLLEFMDEETRKRIEDELIITEEKFENCILCPDTILRIITYKPDEDSEEIRIGYIRLDRIQNQRWKLTSLQVIKAYQDISYIKKIMDLVSKENHVKDIDVSTVSYSRLSMFAKMGFFEHRTAYYLRRQGAETN